jgi:hypothetical protein
MAVIQKTLFPKNLDNYSVLVNDTDVDSKYFKITSLPDTFTGGKNAFLIAGSEYLVPDTKIQIELKDASGNIIYHEPGEGYISSSLNGVPFVTEYYEGISKVVSVYVYPDTAYGPCTLTILGELNSYNSDGITSIVPLDWENKYNVKWQRQINVDPSLANTTKIRFYQRPQVTITEILAPIYRIENNIKVNSGVSQSFANIKLSNLETFAGDVKRVKVFRTSDGDISDFDLIQDILVESKELLTSYDLVGSVVGNTGILTSETLQNYWNTGSLNAFLTSSRVEAGVRLTGSGYFTYTSSLDIKSANTYELNLDAFYSSSTSSNLGVYLSWVSQSINGPITFSSSLATLNGTAPTKNLLDTIIPFKISTDYPTASLYFSQSQGEWHLGNISLKLSQDTAFSPDEITFVTTMPTVIGNETYNFKFEFYDVNNNFVPVAVTQSANFTGGTNTSSTTLLISASLSQSLAALAAVSSSISGTVTNNSSSANTTIVTLSGSVSSSITVVSGSVNTLSGSVSSSISSLSSSVSSSNVLILSSSLQKVQQLANGQFSGSFIGSDVIYSPTIGGQQGFISDLFKVGTSPSIFLDARQNPRKIFIGGVSDSGSYNNSNTTVYMDSTGKFSLGNKLTWDGSSTLTVTGQINIEAGGNAATTTNVSNAVTSGSNAAALAVTSGSLFAANAAASASISASAVDDKVFTNALGRITKVPTSGSTAGLYLGSTNLGYYNGSTWRTYMDNTGLFYLTGSNNGNALLWDGSTLTIKGNLSVGSSVPNSVVTGLGTLALSSSVSTQQMTGLGSLALSSSVSTQQVSGLGALAIKDNITLSYVTDKGSLAALSSVSSAEIDANAVTNAKIAADAVTEGKIATDAVTSGKISADAIIAGKIAANAVTADKIIAGAITAVKISAGAIETDKIAAGAITAAKISAGTITADRIATNTLTANEIAANTITAGNISSLNFTGKTATFDQGTIGGWTINSSNINKAGSTHTIKMDSTNNAFTFTENSTSKLRLAITGSTNIPDISITSQDIITYTHTGTNRYSIATTGANTYNSGGDSNRILTATSGRGDGPVTTGNAGTGIIFLQYPTEEIWVDTSEINADIFFMSLLNNVDTGDANSFTYQTYTLDLRVRKFADYTNANAETNVITTYTRRLAELTRLQSGNEPTATDTINVNGASIEVTSASNWFKVDLVQNMQTIVFEGGTSIMASSTFGADFDGAIIVRFGQIGNGYSILGPGGIQVYQGFRNYMKSAVASAAGANFFEVQGKSTFLSGLAVSGSFSATTKQFQITHPLNEKKWLYHTSVESPRADLIYRGILQLENGSGSVGIDSSSRMTIGTFDTLTKERQLFLQNNDSFDRVMGKIESGSLYVISENTNATASINWLVTAERNDIELQKSNTYFDGKYKVEKYKSIYLKEIDDEIKSKFSGSI